MEARREKGFICPFHYFNGEHFVAEDSDLDENGNCASCGQKFDHNGNPFKNKIQLDQTGGYLYEKILFCPRDMV